MHLCRGETTVLSTLLTPLALAGFFSYADRLLTGKAPGTTTQSKISSVLLACALTPWCSLNAVLPWAVTKREPALGAFPWYQCGSIMSVFT